MKNLHLYAIAALLSAVLSLGTGSTAEAIERQRGMNWCWASSVQDVVRQKTGLYQDQAQIAARLDGWPRDRPAYIHEVVALFRSFGLTAWQAGRPGSPQELVGTLRAGYKLVAFVRPTGGQVGHYIVLQGVDWSGNVVASDPATGRTQAFTLQQLYYGWRWGDSVVVR